MGVTVKRRSQKIRFESFEELKAYHDKHGKFTLTDEEREKELKTSPVEKEPNQK